MGIHLKILAFVALVLGFAAFGPSDRACAGADSGSGGNGGLIAPQTCDTQVWRTMANRARLETEREIMQNQNLIFKPDSILAYTCFDSMAAHAAAQAGVLFTHTNYWSSMPIAWGAPNGMDHAVNQTTLAAMRTYYRDNFQHTYLGGRGNHLDLDQHLVNTTPTSTSTYACSAMGQVWAVAKCLNFIHTAEFLDDGYFPYKDLMPINGGQRVQGYQSVGDTRAFPTACAAADPFIDGDWLEKYHQSRNETSFGAIDAEYQFGTPLNLAFEAVRERIEPGECAAAPVLTGVQVILSPNSGEPYSDGVCTNPGCTFTRGGTCTNAAPVRRGGGGLPPPCDESAGPC